MRQLSGFTLAPGALAEAALWDHKRVLLFHGSGATAPLRAQLEWRWAVPKPQAEPQLSSRLEFCLVWFLPSYKSTITEVLTRSTSPSHGSILSWLCLERKAGVTSPSLIQGQSCRICLLFLQIRPCCQQKVPNPGQTFPAVVSPPMWLQPGYQQRSWSKPQLPHSMFTPMLLYTYSITLGIIKIINKCN